MADVMTAPEPVITLDALQKAATVLKQNRVKPISIDGDDYYQLLMTKDEFRQWIANDDRT